MIRLLPAISPYLRHGCIAGYHNLMPMASFCALNLTFEKNFGFFYYPSSVSNSYNMLSTMCLSADGWLTDDGWGRKTEFCINIHSKRPLFFPKRPSFFSKRPLIFSKQPPFLQSLRIPYKTLRNLDKRRRCLYKYTVLCIFMHFVLLNSPIRQPTISRQPVNI